MFITQDYFCKRIAATVGLKVEFITSDDAPYTGWIEATANSDEELANLYNLIYSFKNNNPFNLIYNQYLLLKNPEGNIIDCYKYNNEEYVDKVSRKAFKCLIDQDRPE